MLYKPFHEYIEANDEFTYSHSKSPFTKLELSIIDDICKKYSLTKNLTSMNHIILSKKDYVSFFISRKNDDYFLIDCNNLYLSFIKFCKIYSSYKLDQIHELNEFINMYMYNIKGQLLSMSYG